MVKLVELDGQVKLAQQMEEDVDPVILINTFHVNPEDGDKLIEAWASDAAYFKQQPGYIYTQLHRGIGGSGTFINYAVWESTKNTKAHIGCIVHRKQSQIFWSILLAQLPRRISLRKLQ